MTPQYIYDNDGKLISSNLMSDYIYYRKETKDSALKYKRLLEENSLKMAPRDAQPLDKFHEESGKLLVN
jgi:hypothetical protein